MDRGKRNYWEEVVCKCSFKEGWSGIKPVLPTAIDQDTTFDSWCHEELP
jgi:hypothetical protein